MHKKRRNLATPKRIKYLREMADYNLKKGFQKRKRYILSLENTHQTLLGDYNVHTEKSFLDWGHIHNSNTRSKSYDQFIVEFTNLEENVKMKVDCPNE